MIFPFFRTQNTVKAENDTVFPTTFIDNLYGVIRDFANITVYPGIR